MKKSISLLLAVVLCLSAFILPASATNVPANTSKAVTRIDLPDGGYIIDQITESPTIARASETKSGERLRIRYAADDTAIYGVKVTGSFSYNGSSSSATSSVATVYIYHSGASYVSKSAWCSGNTAYATGSVKYLGITESRTPSLSCDKNGNLS